MTISASSLLPQWLIDFIRTESAAGIIMLLFAGLALVCANSAFADMYHGFIESPLALGWGAYSATEPLKDWVKDILMVFFFLVVGMELKREMREGFLKQHDQLLLPLLCAAAGMAAPALIFLGVNHGLPVNLNGWAIPSATDIAFALCVLALAGSNMPPAAKTFLLAIAIFDDLGAIIVIAAFYNEALNLQAIALALVGFSVLLLLNRRGVTMIAPYLLVGVYLWFCLYHGGIHTTVAGVIVGLAIPMRGRAEKKDHSPLNQFMHRLHPWVSFLILPFFAFTSAGIDFSTMRLADLREPLPLGIMLGLFFGKQLGIFGIAWVLIRVRLVTKPEGMQWRHLYGIAVIAGIGFTMSLFIGLLAFNDAHLQDMSKLGVIGGSLLSTLWGFAVLRLRFGKIDQPNII